MSNLIRGKEALIALANDEEVEYLDIKEWFSVNKNIENWSVAYEEKSIAPISSLSVRGYKAMIEAGEIK